MAGMGGAAAAVVSGVQARLPGSPLFCAHPPTRTPVQSAHLEVLRKGVQGACASAADAAAVAHAGSQLNALGGAPGANGNAEVLR